MINDQEDKPQSNGSQVFLNFVLLLQFERNMILNEV